MVRSQLRRLAAMRARGAPSTTSSTSGVGSHFLPAIHRRTGDSGVTIAAFFAWGCAIDLGSRRSTQPCAAKAAPCNARPLTALGHRPCPLFSNQNDLQAGGTGGRLQLDSPRADEGHPLASGERCLDTCSVSSRLRR